jgi:plastocyanin
VIRLPLAAVFALTVVALAVLPAAGAERSAVAPPAKVVVTDVAVKPVKVQITANQRVSWRNAGKRAHRIASTGSAWKAFVLGPGKSKVITFRKAGRFPYRIDGRLTGTVVVKKPPPPHVGAYSGYTSQEYALLFHVAPNRSSLTNVHTQLTMTCEGVTGSKAGIPFDAETWTVPIHAGDWRFDATTPFNGSNAQGSAVGTAHMAGSLNSGVAKGTLRVDATATYGSAQFKCTTGTITWTAS